MLCDIDKLERVQKYFTRRISGLKEYYYSERLFILNLESLELRRLYSDLKMYFLIIHKFIDSDYSDLFTVTPGKVTTRGHNFKIVLKKCRLDLSKSSFSNRCVNCLNSLSSDVVNSSSVNIFMTRLKKCDLREYYFDGSDIRDLVLLRLLIFFGCFNYYISKDLSYLIQARSQPQNSKGTPATSKGAHIIYTPKKVVTKSPSQPITARGSGGAL